MPRLQPANDRRHEARTGLKVRHRHRTGTTVVERVSELLYVRNRPVALLEWIDLGGVRTPLYICELDPAKLTADAGQRGLFRYDDETIDPRFADS